MKRIFILALPFLLTGCPSMADRIPADYPATVSLRAGAVCVTVMPEGDEKLAGTSLYRLDDAEHRDFKFFDPLRDITPNQCVPNEGYVFVPGQEYHFSVKLLSPQKRQAGVFPSAREFVTTFALSQVNGALQVKVLPNPR
ncbi:MAG: putative T6SS immunity periplasmic lipoprotein [Serratia inhibens]|uniref:putative T6SS immunity periplasmic lipoprotein n=1 Tax=Serratia inhibens TaxID=2338073 RepID=UPI003C7DC8D0